MKALLNVAKYPAVLIVPFALGLAAQSAHATDTVDWLVFGSGGNASGFSLLDDLGNPAATGALTVSRGSVFSGFPSARSFEDRYWIDDIGLLDSQSGDSLVHATSFRVAAAPGGPASYTIELDVPTGQELLLMVGDIYHGSENSRTAEVILSAFSDTGSSLIQLEGIWAWDNGISAMSENLSWSAGTNTLSPSSAAEGESKAAFFRIAPLYGSNGKLMIEVPDGLAGSGDTIVVALGVMVPEPSAFLMTMAGAAVVMLRRRRNS